MTTVVGNSVLDNSQAHTTLDRLMFPPIDASKVPEASGMTTASAAIADSVDVFAIALTVSIVGNSFGSSRQNTTTTSTNT